MLEGKESCYLLRMTCRRTFLRRVWTMVRHEEVTPAVCTPWVTFYGDDTLPFLLRSPYYIFFAIVEHCMAGLWLLSGTQNLGGASFLYCMYHLISKKFGKGGSKNDLNIPNLWTYIHINIFMFVMKKNLWSRGNQNVHIIHILRYCLCRRMSACMVTVAD